MSLLISLILHFVRLLVGKRVSNCRSTYLGTYLLALFASRFFSFMNSNFAVRAVLNGIMLLHP